MNYQDVLAKLDGRTSRKIGNDAYLIATYRNAMVERVSLRFHGRNVFVWQSDGRTTIGNLVIGRKVTRVITESGYSQFTIETTNQQTNDSSMEND